MRAEWIKLTSIRGTLATLAALIVATVGLSVLIARGTEHPADPAEIRLSGVYFGQMAAAWLGVSAISAEFATGMIHATFLATPNRTRALMAKAATVGVLALGASVIAAVAADAAAGAFIDAPPSPRAIAGGALTMTLVALLGLGAGACVRDANAAMAVVTGVLYAPALLPGLPAPTPGVAQCAAYAAASLVGGAYVLNKS